MTKQRLPLSIEQGLARIAGHLPGGYDRMGEICARQPHTVRAWGDPDKEDDIPLGCAIALDLAFQAEGGEGSPLFETYGAKLDLADATRFSDQHRLLDYAQGVIKEGGEAHAAIVAAARRGATLTEKRVAFKEALEAFEKLRDVMPLLEAGAQTSTTNTKGESDMAQAP